jgi:hypothetical protein
MPHPGFASNRFLCDVRQGPDGLIYLVTDDEESKPTPILRLEPVERTTIR